MRRIFGFLGKWLPRLGVAGIVLSMAFGPIPAWAAITCWILILGYCYFWFQELPEKHPSKMGLALVFLLLLATSGILQHHVREICDLIESPTWDHFIAVVFSKIGLLFIAGFLAGKSFGYSILLSEKEKELEDAKRAYRENLASLQKPPPA